MNNNQNTNVNSRQKERDYIAEQIREFLANGGKIEVVESPFDNAEPKCRVGDEIGFFN